MRRPPSRTTSKESTVVDVDEVAEDYQLDDDDDDDDDDGLPPPLKRMTVDTVPESDGGSFAVRNSGRVDGSNGVVNEDDEDIVPPLFSMKGVNGTKDIKTVDVEMDVSGIDVDGMMSDAESGALVEKALNADETALLSPTSTAGTEEPPKEKRISEDRKVKNHERRSLLNDDCEGDESTDYFEELGYQGRSSDFSKEMQRAANRYSGDMDESHYRLKQRLSMMERMQSKFLNQDESKEKLLPQDTFSFIIIAETCTIPFIISLTIFVLQLTIFILVLLDLAAQGEPGNIFGVPANVSGQLRATQFIAVLVAVLTQGDLRVALTLARDGFTKEFHAAFRHTAEWKFRLAVVTRAASGTIGLVVVFVLIITSSSVVGLLLDFTAVEFVSSIDELCFFLAKQGFLGTGCKHYSAIVACDLYKVAPESRQGFLRKSWKTVSLFLILSVFLAGWISIVIFQLDGHYMCNTIMVNMGDDFVPALGAFNGLYDIKFPKGYVPFKERRAIFVERRSQEVNVPGRGIFGYCDDIKAWTFRWEFTDGTENVETDFCEWVARSSETDTFDITETVSQPWLVRDQTQREVVLDPFRLFCFDCENEGEDDSDDCGGKGTCNSAVCECQDGWYGLRCEFLSPCSELAIDARTEDFASTRDWSSDYQSIELNSGSLAEAYYRPVYVHEYSNGAYDVVMFTGRRWALTSSEFLPRKGRVADDSVSGGQGTGSDIANFFKYYYHGYRGYFDGDYSVAFLSDFMDTTTHFDASTPVAFSWYRAVSEERTHALENQGLGQEVESEFLCSGCDIESNPCLYDGECIAGVCQCSLDSFGELCEIPPVRNGHCDNFFNTPEFKMDGGDCCESTCESTDQYICGAEEQGYVSTGYFNCKLATDKWRAYPLKGDAGSFSGFALDLSMRSMAVSELLQDRVRIYDKVGSSWVLRDTLTGNPGTRFGTNLVLSSGPYNVVSNPSFKSPLTLAVIDGFRTLRIYKCNKDGCITTQEFPMVMDVAVSDDGSVLATSDFVQNQPPGAISVYEEDQNGVFQLRADVNVTRNDVIANLLALDLNGDGSKLVVHSQLTEFDALINFELVTDEYVGIMSWDGASGRYENETEFRFESPLNTLHFPLSLGISQDGNVLAYGFPECDGTQLHIKEVNEEQGWLARPAPSFDRTNCVDNERPNRNNGLAISGNGDRIAFRVGTNVSYFQWEPEGWNRIGDPFPLTHYPVSMSSDGTELAIGSPEDDIGGVTGVYSLPGRKVCPSDMSLLRVSLTIDRLPQDVTWNILNNSTGETLFEQGPYPPDYAFATVVEEKCIASDSCYVFSIYNKRNRGLQAPGQYAVFLDGENVASGSFSGLFERKEFGNCISCPDGTQKFSMMMLACGVMDWAVLQLINRGESNSTVLQYGNTLDKATTNTVYQTCFEHDVGRDCPSTFQVKYDACLDPTECYGVNVFSKQRHTAYLELAFGEERVKAKESAVCNGETFTIGQEDKCFQEEDWINGDGGRRLQSFLATFGRVAS
ncbi:expressed unknown protein [Seminavis robusta]|uniref:EGF-like domain-containing protein n=1 Tax=Seminavis robusta TaxID=568900 RepID=A0A9N8DV21_9STRA|nr:expressed unknown protein [Seminavis robusta]|eukprot:Sro381_g130810.1 n/a (1504) ;mRNA; r:24694-29481